MSTPGNIVNDWKKCKMPCLHFQPLPSLLESHIFHLIPSSHQRTPAETLLDLTVLLLCQISIYACSALRFINLLTSIMKAFSFRLLWKGYCKASITTTLMGGYGLVVGETCTGHTSGLHKISRTWTAQ